MEAFGKSVKVFRLWKWGENVEWKRKECGKNRGMWGQFLFWIAQSVELVLHNLPQGFSQRRLQQLWFCQGLPEKIFHLTFPQCVESGVEKSELLVQFPWKTLFSRSSL